LRREIQIKRSTSLKKRPFKEVDHAVVEDWGPKNPDAPESE